MPKTSIREHYLAKRVHCSAETCLGLSLEIQERFAQSRLFAESRCLALYNAIRNEVLTEDVARRARAAGKRLVYPRIENDRLVFVEVAGPQDLAAGTFGILEPVGEHHVPPGEIDTLVVPGVAFDETGHRLGYGKGFYDRMLAADLGHTVKVGFAYDFQVMESLPAATHDQPLSFLVTESRIYDFSA